MIVLLSPAKTLDFDTPARTGLATQPDFLDDAQRLVERLRRLSPARIVSLMSVSDEIAALNAERFGRWSRPFDAGNAKPAVLAFAGDVYGGLDATSLDDDGLAVAQSRLRIVSGLYGLLRPLDLMQPYRLEMGTRLPNSRGKDLYAFWGDRIARRLAEELAATGGTVLVNLASDEYFKAVRGRLPTTVAVVSPVFEDRRGEEAAFKVVGFWAKRARGSMARWIVDERVRDPARLPSFAREGYRFDPAASTIARPVFRRTH